MRKAFRFFAFLLFLALIPASAWCTWSIIAFDPESGEAGSAGCSYSPAVWMIVHPASGKGMVVAQAATNYGAGERMAIAISAGTSPARTVAEVARPDFDVYWSEQQYAAIDARGESASFTGSACAAWAGAVSARGVSIQGNMLVNQAVADRSLEAYLAAREAGKPMAERLILALEAGAAMGGDRRAAPAGYIAGLTAYVLTTAPGDAPGRPSFALVALPPPKGESPVDRLRAQYDSLDPEGRVRHPLYFPHISLVYALAIGLPLLIGLILALCSRGLATWLLPPLGASATYGALLLAAALARWVHPFNAELSVLAPAIDAIGAFALAAIVVAARFLAGRISRRRFASGIASY